jgi:hypothetical protein
LNTVRDLFGDQTIAVDSFVGQVSVALADQQLRAAEALAARAVTDLVRLMGCDVMAQGDACARSFVERFGGRAFRRPLAASEVGLYMALYGKGAAAFDRRVAVDMVVQTMLQSPFFLYRPEIGAAPISGVAALTPYELASRLSYFVTDTMPDAELFAAAADGRLLGPDGVMTQARRLLGTPRARQVMSRFADNWLGLSQLPDAQRRSDSMAYTAGLRPVMVEETRRFVEHVLSTANVSTLYTAPFTFANGPLAALYGARATGNTLSQVNLVAAQRSGILTHASFLTINAEFSQPHPVLRGKVVRTRFMCDELPPTPPGLEVVPPEVKPGVSNRQRWVQHSADPGCVACHNMMDKIGFAFDNYDAVGAWRESDAGKPIDASGEIVGASSISGPFKGAIELGKKLAQSREANACMVTLWYRNLARRLETAADRCVLDQLTGQLIASDGKLMDMLVAMTGSPAFVSRQAIAQ